MTPRLIVERQMTEEESREWITAEECALSEGFAPRRRREFRAWRALVRRELGRDAELAYDEVGAPVVKNRRVRIGVSHSKDRVAVVISEERCAVDIESLARNFDRVRAHYLTDDEAGLESDPRFGAAAWSAKETLYKFGGLTGLDLKADLRLERADLEGDRGGIIGRICGGEPLRIEVRFDEEYVVTYIL